MSMANFKPACMAAALLFPMAAWASFGGGTPCKDFGCHFLFWGVLLGVVGGIPFSALGFLLLHLFACNPERSKGMQALLGGLVGIVAFEVAAACTALMATMAKPGQYERLPWLIFAAVYVAVGIASFLHARSSPPDRGKTRMNWSNGNET
jgi:uncharacterized BrkB/YihY/UPF0761 family membrane protein